MKKISAVMRGEVAELKPRVAEIFKKVTPGDAPEWSNRPTLPTLIAFSLNVFYEVCDKQGLPDADAIKNMSYKSLGLDPENMKERFRTSFMCSDALLERLDTFTRDYLQRELSGQGKVNRNFSIYFLLKLVVIAYPDRHNIPIIRTETESE